MFSRLHPLVYVSALALAALQCKSSDTAASKSPDAVHPDPVQNANGPAGASEGVGASGVTVQNDERKPAPSAALDDGQIVAITAAANTAEIEQGRLAQEKASDPRVRDFGAMMVDHHGEARQDQQKLSVGPTQSTDAQRMERDAEDALRSLKQKKGKDFDLAYLQLQIDEHRKVRDELQDKLLPSAKDSGVKAYLEDIKPKVESHLAQAERLQEELNGTGSLNDSNDQRPVISNEKSQPHSAQPHSSQPHSSQPRSSQP
jgi:putative membrane protein